MSAEEKHSLTVEEVSASLAHIIDGIRLHPGPSTSASASSVPSAADMKQALGKGAPLGKAKSDFLAGLLDGVDDPARHDYGERYEYLDELGKGGQGRVLRFRDKVLDRDVAIKVIKPPCTPEKERLLENEARLGGMLEHPNILPTYDLCRDEAGSPFFVMKKVEGVSLDELLRDAHAADGSTPNLTAGDYSRRRLLNIFLQVCHAIEYAHSRGVCHLDLKPQNVKLGKFGEVYVLDWGFAARAEEPQKKVGGTGLYIAPERFRRAPPDARCDIYSLGVMLYRILVNALPRDVGKISLNEFIKRIAEFPIVPPRQRDPGLPKDLDAIVLKAMAEDPAERYQTVHEFSRDLERFLDILPVSAYREGVWGRTVKFARRHKAPVMAGLVMIMAVILTIAASWRARRLALLAREKEQEAVERARDQERQMEMANLRRILAEEEQAALEQARKELLRRRAAARVPMEKGLDIMDKSKTAVDKERDQAAKLLLLQPAIDFFTDAQHILEAGHPDSPESAEAYYNRARAWEMARDFARAADDYRQTIARDESYIMAHYQLGQIYFNIDGSVQKAMAEFAAMNAIDPGNEFSEIGQAYIEAHTGSYASAMERIDRIEARERATRRSESEDDTSWRNPGLSNIWLIRGLIYGREDSGFYDPEKAIRAYTAYCVYNPDKPAPYLNRGRLRLSLAENALKRGKTDEAQKMADAAIEDFGHSLSLDPRYKFALEHRGYALFKYKNKPDEALADIEAAIAIDPNYVTAILDRAALRETQHKYDLAEQDYLRVREIQPNNRNVDYRMGILYLYTNRLEDSEEALNKAVQVSSTNAIRAIRIHRRGIIRFLLGRFEQALDDFDTSLELRKTGRIYPALMRWLTLTKLGRPTPAEELAAQADSDPDKPWLDEIAGIFMGEGPFDEDQAIGHAQTPEAICETGFYLGARAWALGENVNAIEYLRKSVDSKVELYMEYSMSRILLDRLIAQQETAARLPDTIEAPVQTPVPELPVPPPASVQPFVEPAQEPLPAEVLQSPQGIVEPNPEPQNLPGPLTPAELPKTDLPSLPLITPEASARLAEQTGLPPTIPSISDLIE